MDIKSKIDFKFYTRLALFELTGRTASNLQEFLEEIESADDSVIFYHTHQFLLEHNFLVPEPPNDLAEWVINALHERALGERLASIDTFQFADLSLLKDKIVEIIRTHLEQEYGVKKSVSEKGLLPKKLVKAAGRLFFSRPKKEKSRFGGVVPEEKFHFIRSTSFVFPTPYTANTLSEFRYALSQVSLNSIYYHLFESRLRFGKADENHFSSWLENGCGLPDLAKEINRLTPYTRTLEELRHKMISLIDKKMSKE